MKFQNIDPERFIDGLHGYLEKQFSPVIARLKTLEKEVTKIQKRGVEYKGVFQRALEYKRGDVTTYNGSAWIAVADLPKGIPGDSQDWQLLVKGTR